jgi:hypothetical protein
MTRYGQISVTTGALHQQEAACSFKLADVPWAGSMDGLSWRLRSHTMLPRHVEFICVWRRRYRDGYFDQKFMCFIPFYGDTAPPDERRLTWADDTITSAEIGLWHFVTG